MLDMDSRGSVSYTYCKTMYNAQRHLCTDVAKLGSKVVSFYRKKGGEVVSPLISAL